MVVLAVNMVCKPLSPPNLDFGLLHRLPGCRSVLLRRFQELPHVITSTTSDTIAALCRTGAVLCAELTFAVFGLVSECHRVPCCWPVKSFRTSIHKTSEHPLPFTRLTSTCHNPDTVKLQAIRPLTEIYGDGAVEEGPNVDIHVTASFPGYVLLSRKRRSSILFEQPSLSLVSFVWFGILGRFPL